MPKWGTNRKNPPDSSPDWAAHEKSVKGVRAAHRKGAVPTAAPEPNGESGAEAEFSASSINEMNVGEAQEFIARIDSEDQLDELVIAEGDGKARKGVLDAIEARRAELADGDEDGGDEE